MKNLFKATTLSYADSRYEKTTNRVETETALNIRKYKSSDTDKASQPILCSFTSTGKCKKDFNQSNICFVDLDTTEFTYYILNNSEKVFESLPFILAIQKSFSGKIHLICRMPLVDNIADFMKQSFSVNESVYEFLKLTFNKDITYGYGSNEEGIHFDIDLNSTNIHQLMYVSKNDFIFNYKYDESKVDISFFNKVNFYNEFINKVNNYIGGKSCTTGTGNNPNPSSSSTTEEYSTTFSTTLSNSPFIKDFDNSIEVKYLNRQLHLDYSVTTQQLEEIRENIIEAIENNKVHYGRLLMKPHIQYEGIVDVKMYYFIKRDKNNNIVKIKQGGKRRYHLMKWIKQTILNAIATLNNNGGYEYMYKDIVYTIYNLYYNCIEISGNGGKNNRDILDRLMIRLVNRVINEWDSLKVEYMPNRYIAKAENKITTFQDLIKYWQILRDYRYNAIENTFSDMMVTLSLQGKKYSEIANILNENNVEAKTSKGWTKDSVINIMEKLGYDNKCEYEEVINRLISEGKCYADIAEHLNIEGYTTKQGKSFKIQNIKDYVRKLKNTSNDTERFLIIEKVKDMKDSGYKYEEIAETLSVAFGKTFNENDVKNIVRRNLK